MRKTKIEYQITHSDMDSYKKFVKDENDLAGKIAFADFHNAVIAANEAYRKNHQGSGPSPEVFEGNEASLSTKLNVDKYRKNAAEQLGRYYVGYLTTQFSTDLIGRIKKECKTPFWHGVLQSLIASAIWVAIAAAIILQERNK